MTSFFNATRFAGDRFTCQCEKEDQKKKKKSLRVSNFALLWIVFKWHHGMRGLSTIRDGEPRTSTSTFTQLFSSESRFVDATLNCQGRSEFRSCVKVKVAVLGSPSLTVLKMVSVDVKQH